MTSLLASFLGVMVDVGCNGRCSASIAYPFPYSGMSCIVFGLDLLLHGFDWINRG
jgi:hypothetical protein